MAKRKKSKEDRNRDREIYNQYHQKLTENALEPLYKDFIDWKSDKLPYFELTERIHEFHKENQKIWLLFNTFDWNDKIFMIQAKEALHLLSNEEKEKYETFL